MSTESNELVEKKDHSFRWFIGSIFIVIAIWLFNAYGYPLINDSLVSRANNGDMFGPTNALFSGLAFAGLIYTIVMQRNELEMQRRELRLQREAMSDSAGEQAKQAQAQKKQLAALKRQNRLTTMTHDIEMSKIMLDRLYNSINDGPTLKQYEHLSHKIDNELAKLSDKYDEFNKQESEYSHRFD